MTLRGLQRSCDVPRGGVMKVEIVCTSDGFDPAAGPDVGFDALRAAFSSSGPAVGWAFREDGARYTETPEGDVPFVRHTLTMEFAAAESSRRAMAALAARSGEGFVAVVTMATGERLLAGWSQRFGLHYLLRLKAIASDSGASPGEFSVLRLTLESIDADYSTINVSFANSGTVCI